MTIFLILEVELVTAAFTFDKSSLSGRKSLSLCVPCSSSCEDPDYQVLLGAQINLFHLWTPRRLEMMGSSPRVPAELPDPTWATDFALSMMGSRRTYPYQHHRRAGHQWSRGKDACKCRKISIHGTTPLLLTCCSPDLPMPDPTGSQLCLSSSPVHGHAPVPHARAGRVASPGWLVRLSAVRVRAASAQHCAPSECAFCAQPRMLRCRG